MNKPVEKKPLPPKLLNFVERYGIVLYIWLLLVVARWFMNSEALLRGELKGNDDHMRMVQIRDWLQGQNWFDLHQYRLNPDDPLLSHWSRLTDVIVGIPVWLLTPVFGQKTAELITATAIPSILLLIFLYLIIELTKELKRGTVVPLAAAFMTALSFPTVSQFDLGRIDHHGLQLAMAVVCCWFIVKSASQVKYAAFAGVMAGFGLYVGLESAPYIAAACVAMVFVWILDEPNAAKRLRQFGIAMAASTLFCLIISAPPSRWMNPTCDAISVVYVNLTLMVAVALLIFSYMGGKFKSAFARFSLAAVLGAVTIVATVMIYPHCFAGPYSEVDPRLVELWLSNVAEAKPFHFYISKKPVGGMVIIILPIFAYIGWWLYHHHTKRGLSIAPRTIMIFTSIALLAGMFQIRLMGYASSFAIPLAAYLLISVYTWSEKFESAVKRTAIRMGAIVLLAPITIPVLIGFLVPQIPTPETQTTQTSTCLHQPVLSNLDALGPSMALTQIDLGAAILYNTEDLKVSSAPYHRNTGGNLASIDMFFGDEDTAKAAVDRINADYVIACRSTGETRSVIQRASDGMLSQLYDGNIPDWLETVEMDGTEDLMIFKVVRTN